MVPVALAGPDTRSARLGLHGKRVARRAKGLEAALVDRQPTAIGALDPSDARSVTMLVAGPGALLVAKVHKIAERTNTDNRMWDKDALDVLRLLQATVTTDLAERFDRLRGHELSAAVNRSIPSTVDTRHRRAWLPGAPAGNGPSSRFEGFNADDTLGWPGTKGSYEQS